MRLTDKNIDDYIARNREAIKAVRNPYFEKHCDRDIPRWMLMGLERAFVAGMMIGELND